MQSYVLANIDQEREKLRKKRDRLIVNFAKAAEAGKQKRLSELFLSIRQANDFLESLEQIAKHVPEGKPARRYTVSSLFLQESFKKLTASADEEFVFITGSEIDGVLVLDQWAEFAHEKKSPLAVTGDVRATHSLLIRLENFGHRLLASFHSHPGRGAEATAPSGTDERFQKRLEAAGHIAVMAIFSRDGFIRFLRLDSDIDIQVFGTGVEKHGPGIFRLTSLD
ncbi:MAG TPA: hypothetical protein VN736_10755 [Candidatus Limnocylindrales bacterium]|nr:hypothetical protein [Candidatus Limnocylindrales bacterium]